MLQLAAPGSYILSTLPLSQGSFGRMRWERRRAFPLAAGPGYPGSTYSLPLSGTFRALFLDSHTLTFRPDYCSGTSMATPLVAAAAAQLAAAFAARAWRVPSYLELKRALLGSVDPFPNGNLSVAT